MSSILARGMKIFIIPGEHDFSSFQVENVHLYLPTFSEIYKRQIFILGVLGFLKTTRSFPKISEEVRSLPKKSEDF